MTGSKKRYASVFSSIYVIAVVLICGLYLYEQRLIVEECWSRVASGDLFLSLVLLLLCYLSFTVFFSGVQKEVESPKVPLSFSQWFCGFIYGYVGRYIPGKVSIILGRIQFFAEYGLSKKAITISALYENILQVVVSLIFGLPVAFVGFSSSQETVSHFWVTLLFILISLVFLFSPAFEKVFVLALKVLKKDLPSGTQFLKPRQIVGVFPWCLLTILLSSMSFVVLLNSLTPISKSPYSLYTVGATYVFSSAAGVLALFAPSGIGVREGCAVFLLSQVQGIVQTPPLLMSLLAMRILHMVMDLFLFLVAQVLCSGFTAERGDAKQ